VHSYLATVTWSGNTGSGFRAYSRDHEIAGAGKPVIAASSDPAFRGDASRWNPEELLVASLAQCHMLWFLHLAAMTGIAVVRYVDRATGTMSEHPDGSGEFTEVSLHPDVTVLDPARTEEAEELHHRAHALCFIARSVNFPVTTTPTTTASSPSQTP
jgi:organic hydroperoxide reductase OsmC/OhrA